MSNQQITRRAVMLMWATGIVGMTALLGSAFLSVHQRPGYAMVWFAFGTVNVVLYAINLRIYRRFNR